MPVAGGGFEQCYNAQAAVAAGSMLVVAVDVVAAPNDKQQLEPMLVSWPPARVRGPLCFVRISQPSRLVREDAA